MKRFYLIHESMWNTPVQFPYHVGALGSAFHGAGCTWWDLGNGNRIVAGDFSCEDFEHVWNSHEAVTHFHHPVKERSLPLSALLTSEHAHKRFTSSHLDMLRAALGATPEDTLDSLNQKVAQVHPGCVIYPVPKQTQRWIY